MNTIKDWDSKETSVLIGKIIKDNGILDRLYIDFYKYFKEASGECNPLVELGSNDNLAKKGIPNIITSNMQVLPDVDMNFSILNIPYRNNSIGGFLMINTLHHLSDTRKGFSEMERCLKAGGKIVMIEPSSTILSRVVYKITGHPERHYKQGTWNTDSCKPYSSANIAIPWIIFKRDRKIFENEFPNLIIKQVKVHTILPFLLSGGVRYSYRHKHPEFKYKLLKLIDKALFPLNPLCGMIMTIELEKRKS